MSQLDDIVALLRVVREQYALIDSLKKELHEVEIDRENYQRWWLADSDELRQLRETLEAKTKEEQK